MRPIPPPAAASRTAPAALLAWPWRALARALRWGTLLLLVAWSIVIAAWLVLQWGILPRLDAWRPALEARASAALGVRVRIGTLAAVDGGALRWSRAIELREVVLEAERPGAPPALRLPRVRAALSPASLLPGWDGRWRLRFDQLLVEGAALEIERDADGRIHVAGIALDGGAAGSDGSAGDWLFSQHELAVRQARVRWRDALRPGAQPLELHDVDLVLRNGARRHALRLDATPPADHGARFSLRGQFSQPLLAGTGAGVLGRPGDWRRWRGTLHADLPGIDLAAWRAHVDPPFGLQQARGALRAWLEVRDGALRAVTADLALQALALQPEPDTAPLAFEQVGGRLSAAWDRDADGLLRSGSLQARGVGFHSADGLWPADDLRLGWRLAPDGGLAGVELTLPRVDLALLAATVARLPPRWGIDAALQARLAGLAPRGIASGVEARWDAGADGAPPRYRLRGRLEQLALDGALPEAVPGDAAPARPRPGRPGIAGADIDFDASDAGGEARIAVRDGALEFPGVFAQPRIPFERLDTVLGWRIAPAAADGAAPQIEVQARALRFANADLQGEFEARWSTGTAEGRRFPGVLELDGRLGPIQATRVVRYLPLVLGERVPAYLGRALQAGRATGIDVQLRGDLYDFPFRPGEPAAGRAAAEGRFRVVARLDGVRYAYLPGGTAEQPAETADAPAWPALTEVQGELVFDRQALELRGLQARLGSVGSGAFALRNVRGRIADLGRAPVLALEGQGRGPLADALGFVAATPVAGWIGGALDQAELGPGPQAPVELQLALELPLADGGAEPTVRGKLALAGNDVRLRPDLPLFGQAKARIDFGSEAGTPRFALAGGSARLLGGEASVEGARQADGSLRFTAQGSASAEGLRRASELGALARAADTLNGQTGYRLALAFVDGQPEWQLTSNLVGLSAALPAPLGKSAEQALPLRVQASRLPPAGGVSRDLLRVELGEGARLVQAQWLRAFDGATTRVLRGGIGVQDAMPLPAEGVAAQLRLERLDLDAWRRVVAQWEGGEGGGAAPGAGRAARGPAAGADAAGYAPATIALRAEELHTGGRRLHRLVAGLSRGSGGEAGVWRANLDAVELEGYAEYRPAGSRAAGRGEPAGQIYARLARLSLPQSEAEAVDTLLGDAAPAALPALDLVVEDLQLRGLGLGRAEVQARHRDGAGGAHWQLERLRLQTADAELNATGRWAASGGAPQRRVGLDFRLDVLDGGALLARLGHPDQVRGAKGRLEGRVGWLGSPLAIDHASLDGEFRIALERGQFLQAEPGIAKLLGVLSLQALPRRLALDFRDVFQQGFAFDDVSGDVRIAGGVAHTRNLRMRGVQAVVLMEGSADIARETQDLRVWVVPELNAGTASLAVAAINPVLGVGAFIAQWLLRRPIGEAGTREFHISGPWADPKVARVEGAQRERPPPAEASAPPAVQEGSPR